MTIAEIVERLRDFFTEAEDDTLYFLANAAQQRAFAAGETLCNEGVIEDVFYILLAGQVEIYRYMDGEMILVDYLTPTNIVGAFSLLLQTPRTSDVVASEQVHVLEIDREIFNAIIETHPQVLLMLTRIWIRRMLNQESKRLVDIARQRKAMTTQQRLFVSYSRVDEAFVRKVSRDLKKHHINVWLDVFDIEAGASWSRQIGAALDTCEAMILILSPDSMASGNVEDEWNYYLDKHKPILPVLYKPCDIPYRLYKLQYVDFHEVVYQSALVQLVAASNQLLRGLEQES